MANKNPLKIKRLKKMKFTLKTNNNPSCVLPNPNYNPQITQFFLKKRLVIRSFINEGVDFFPGLKLLPKKRQRRQLIKRLKRVLNYRFSKKASLLLSSRKNINDILRTIYKIRFFHLLFKKKKGKIKNRFVLKKEKKLKMQNNIVIRGRKISYNEYLKKKYKVFLKHTRLLEKNKQINFVLLPRKKKKQVKIQKSLIRSSLF